MVSPDKKTVLVGTEFSFRIPHQPEKADLSTALEQISLQPSVPRDVTFNFGKSDASTTPVWTPPTTTCHLEKLPYDIAVGIFFAVLDRTEPLSRDTSPLLQHQRLAGVCRGWRDIVLSTPSFWTLINSTDMLERRLELSNPMLLDIDITLFGKHSIHIETLGRHQHRWRKLVVFADLTQIVQFLDCLEKPTPELRHLDLRSMTPCVIYPLTLSDAPKLRILRMDLGLPELLPSLLSHLQSMSLKSLSAHVLSNKLLLDVVRYCSVLEELELDHIGMELPSHLPPDAEELEIMPLPLLRRVRMVKVHDYIMLPILRSIPSASLQSLAIIGLPPSSRSPGSYEDEPLWYEDVLPRLISSVVQNNPPSEAIVSGGPNEFSIQCGDALLMELKYIDQASSILPHLIPLYPLGSIPVDFEINLSMDHVRLKSTITLPNDVMNIVKLRLTASSFSSTEWFWSLLESRQYGRGIGAYWVCPNVERISVDVTEPFSIDVVKPVVESLFAGRYRPDAPDRPKHLILDFGRDTLFHSSKPKQTEKFKARRVVDRGPPRNAKRGAGHRSLADSAERP